ncbi:hypothetical protein PIB30_058242 [Stylosanthes scabra]|uniref:Uncharacterized protein n=1 Tax=Stylosanthes scabra TaxID=79078 RepID=A0ABU6WI38_9FABA|nr:hypothetical protein [Stylosanthes scabra]
MGLDLIMIDVRSVGTVGRTNITDKICSHESVSLEVLVRLDKQEPKDLWQEPLAPASTWRPLSTNKILLYYELTPCSLSMYSEGNNGNILVTVNGGINQQRVAENHRDDHEG